MKLRIYSHLGIAMVKMESRLNVRVHEFLWSQHILRGRKNLEAESVICVVFLSADVNPFQGVRPS